MVSSGLYCPQVHRGGDEPAYLPSSTLLMCCPPTHPGEGWRVTSNSSWHQCELQPNRGHLFLSPCSYCRTGQFLRVFQNQVQGSSQAVTLQAKAKQESHWCASAHSQRHLSEQPFTGHPVSVPRAHPAADCPCFPFISFPPQGLSIIFSLSSFFLYTDAPCRQASYLLQLNGQPAPTPLGDSDALSLVSMRG